MILTGMMDVFLLLLPEKTLHRFNFRDSPLVRMVIHVLALVIVMSFPSPSGLGTTKLEE